MLGQLVLAARGQKDHFTITGTEHPTPDGTGVRDYVHVWDLAKAHVRAVERFDEVLAEAGARSVIMNVGRGEGVTVRQLVAAFESVFGSEVPTDEAPPRPGDAVGRVRQRRPGPPAAALGGRAVRRGRHRLRPRLGRQAQGRPGVRVMRLGLVGPPAVAASGRTSQARPPSANARTSGWRRLVTNRRKLARNLWFVTIRTFQSASRPRRPTPSPPTSSCSLSASNHPRPVTRGSPSVGSRTCIRRTRRLRHGRSSSRG